LKPKIRRIIYNIEQVFWLLPFALPAFPLYLSSGILGIAWTVTAAVPRRTFTGFPCLLLQTLNIFIIITKEKNFSNRIDHLRLGCIEIFRIKIYNSTTIFKKGCPKGGVIIFYFC